MAKKRFTDGLETLFGASELEKDFEDKSPLLTKEQTKSDSKPTQKKKSSKRKSGKSFTSDLDSLFSNVVYQKKESKPQKAKISKPEVENEKPNTIFGLDALIRKTSDLKPEEIQVVSTKKRVTFIYDKEKLELLKKIARHKNAYMKDIIGDAVNKWIKEYEDKNGKISPN